MREATAIRYSYRYARMGGRALVLGLVMRIPVQYDVHIQYLIVWNQSNGILLSIE
jgi:hypothetical protein